MDFHSPWEAGLILIRQSNTTKQFTCCHTSSAWFVSQNSWPSTSEELIESLVESLTVKPPSNINCNPDLQNRLRVLACCSWHSPTNLGTLRLAGLRILISQKSEVLQKHLCTDGLCALNSNWLCLSLRFSDTALYKSYCASSPRVHPWCHL